MQSSATQTAVPTIQPTEHPVAGHIRDAAEATGVSFEFLLAQANQESRLNPDARNRRSTAMGLYQFTTGTWLEMVKRHGAEHGLGKYADAITADKDGRWTIGDAGLKKEILDLRRDPKLSALMAGEYAKDNTEILEGRLGRKVSSHDLYLAHFLGPGGAIKVLQSRHQPEDQQAQLPSAARANPEYFRDPQSGETRPLSDVYTTVERRFQQAMNGANDVVDGMRPQVDLAALQPVERPTSTGSNIMIAAIPPSPIPLPDRGTTVKSMIAESQDLAFLRPEARPDTGPLDVDDTSGADTQIASQPPTSAQQSPSALQFAAVAPRPPADLGVLRALLPQTATPSPEAPQIAAAPPAAAPAQSVVMAQAVLAAALAQPEAGKSIHPPQPEAGKSIQPPQPEAGKSIQTLQPETAKPVQVAQAEVAKPAQPETAKPAQVAQAEVVKPAQPETAKPVQVAQVEVAKPAQPEAGKPQPLSQPPQTAYQPTRSQAVAALMERSATAPERSSQQITDTILAMGAVAPSRQQPLLVGTPTQRRAQQIANAMLGQSASAAAQRLSQANANQQMAALVQNARSAAVQVAAVPPPQEPESVAAPVVVAQAEPAAVPAPSPAAPAAVSPPEQVAQLAEPAPLSAQPPQQLAAAVAPVPVAAPAQPPAPVAASAFVASIPPALRPDLPQLALSRPDSVFSRQADLARVDGDPAQLRLGRAEPEFRLAPDNPALATPTVIASAAGLGQSSARIASTPDELQLASDDPATVTLSMADVPEEGILDRARQNDGGEGQLFPVPLPPPIKVQQRADVAIPASLGSLIAAMEPEPPQG